MGAALSLAGCHTCRPCVTILPGVRCAPSYWRVTLTDFEGCPISEYIAEGPVCENGCGVNFWAIQRKIFTPFPLTFRYPLGRPVQTGASHIIVVPAPKPYWLCGSEK